MTEADSIKVNSAEVKRVIDAAVAANIKILENFFSFLISFALTQATLKLADAWSSASISSPPLGRSVLYISLLVTIVPFYQGMSRFLYSTHVVRPLEIPGSRSSPMLLDIWAFLIMSCIIFAMGRFLNDPVKFFCCWSALLTVDICWTSIVWRIQKSQVPKWAVNNALWLALAWGYWIIGHRNSVSAMTEPIGTELLPYGFVCFEICRTILDYRLNWSFYFPPEYRGE